MPDRRYAHDQGRYLPGCGRFDTLGGAEPDLGTVMRNPGAESWVATTLAPCASRPSPHLPHHAGAAVDARGRRELAVEFGEEGPAVGELVHGAAGGEHAVARRHGAVDDEVRAGQRLEDRARGRAVAKIVRPGDPAVERHQRAAVEQRAPVEPGA